MENPSKIGWFEKYPYCRKPLPIFLHSADVFTKKCSTAEIHSENELRCQPQSCSNTVGTKTEIHLWSAIFHIIYIYTHTHILICNLSMVMSVVPKSSQLSANAQTLQAMRTAKDKETPAQRTTTAILRGMLLPKGPTKPVRVVKHGKKLQSPWRWK